MGKQNKEVRPTEENEETVKYTVPAPTVAPEVAPTPEADNKGIVGEPGEPGDKYEDSLELTENGFRISSNGNITIENDDDFERIVEETLRGVHGSGRERMLVLGENYAKVQKEVNKRMRNK